MNPYPEPEILPLFALPMLVLPGETTALHIFEPRYRAMMADGLKAPDPRGEFVLQYDDGTDCCPLAARVRILKVLHRHPDGRLDILIQGVSRVSVLARIDLPAYPGARVKDCLDLSEDWDDALATRVYALHRQLLVSVTGDEPPDAFYAQAGGIAYKVATCSGMDTAARLQLLGLRDETARLQAVVEHLSHKLPLIREVLPLARGVAAAYALSCAAEGTAGVSLP